MAQQIEMPNGDKLEFPDGMPDSEMQSAIFKEYPQYAPKGTPFQQARQALRAQPDSMQLPTGDSIQISDVIAPTQSTQSVMDLPRQVATGQIKNTPTQNLPEPSISLSPTGIEDTTSRATTEALKSLVLPTTPSDGMQQLNQRLTGQPVASIPTRAAAHEFTPAASVERVLAQESLKTNPDYGKVPTDRQPWTLQGLTNTYTDFGKDLMSGLAGISTTTGQAEKLLGLEKIGQQIVDEGDSAQKYWSSLKSDYGKDADSRKFIRSGDFSSFGNAINTLATGNFELGDANMTTVAGQAIQSAPGMIAMGGVGKLVSAGLIKSGALDWAANLLEKAGIARPIAEKTARYVADGVSFGGSEGVFSGLQNAAQTGVEIRGMDFDKLKQSDSFNKHLSEQDTSLPEAERMRLARNAVASDAESAIVRNTIITTGGISALSGGGVFGILNRGNGTLAGRMAAGAGSEFSQEFSQSGLEQYWQNKGMQLANPSQNLSEGVAEQSVQGGVVGGVMGLAGGGGVARPQANNYSEGDQTAPTFTRNEINNVVSGTPESVPTNTPQENPVTFSRQELEQVISGKTPDTATPAPQVLPDRYAFTMDQLASAYGTTVDPTGQAEIEAAKLMPRRAIGQPQQVPPDGMEKRHGSRTQTVLSALRETPTQEAVNLEGGSPTTGVLRGTEDQSGTGLGSIGGSQPQKAGFGRRVDDTGTAGIGDNAGTQGVPAPVRDRRHDEIMRKLVSEMTHDELRQVILTDHITGLANRRAYSESPKQAYQASIDVDGLKWVNDNLGHAAGDQLLQTVASALAGKTPNAFHISGDEFIVQGQSPEELHTALRQAQEALKNSQVSATLPDGKTITMRGVGFSYGVATDLHEAETLLQKDKAARQKQGLRAGRGETPSGVIQTPNVQGEQIAVQKPSPGEILQREPQEAGSTRGKRGRMEPLQQGIKPAEAIQTVAPSTSTYEVPSIEPHVRELLTRLVPASRPDARGNKLKLRPAIERAKELMNGTRALTPAEASWWNRTAKHFEGVDAQSGVAARAIAAIVKSGGQTAQTATPKILASKKVIPVSTLEVALPVKLQSKQEMIDRGASGYLNSAYERYIPVSKIVGREPAPSASDEEGYVKGRVISLPVEVSYDKNDDSYTLYAGNHRVVQAELNGDKYIRAWIEPDGGVVGKSAMIALPSSRKVESKVPLFKSHDYYVTDAGNYYDGNTPISRAEYDAAMHNGTPQVSDQTSSPAFKAWFGDSKVVDADGKPLVVYRGEAVNFDESPGQWYTSSIQVSNAYAQGSVVDGFEEGANIIPAYLSLQNPMVYDAHNARYDSLSLDGVYHNTDTLAQEAIDRGYDGLIVRNVKDGTNDVIDVYRAFKLSQIKSAVGNNGDFSLTNPNILASKISSEEQTFAQQRTHATSDDAILAEIKKEQRGWMPYIGKLLARGTAGERGGLVIGTESENMARAAELIAKKNGTSPDHEFDILRSTNEHYDSQVSRDEQVHRLQDAFDYSRDNALKDYFRGLRIDDKGKQYRVYFASTKITASAQTETPEFKRWFGNSKVVDDQGNPRVMYHSTDADFDSFKRRVGDVGMHFGTIGQATDRADYRAERHPETLHGSNVMPVYLSIQNPLRLNDPGLWNPANLAFQLQLKFPNDRVSATPNLWDAESKTWKRTGVYLKTTKDIREYLQSKGYDGVVYKNTGEVSGAATLRAEAMFDYEASAKLKRYIDDNAEDSYIAFERTQIKSAIGNSGAFSTRDPRILFSKNTEPLEIEKFSKGIAKTQGFYSPEIGVSFINRDNVTAKEAVAIILHEMTHSADTRGEMTALGKEVLNRLDKYSGIPIYNRVLDRMEKAGQIGNPQEALNYLVEEALQDAKRAGYSRLDSGFFGWLQRQHFSLPKILKSWIAAIRAALYNHGKLKAENLTVDDMIAVAVAGMKDVATGKREAASFGTVVPSDTAKTVTVKPKIQMSKKAVNDIPESPEEKYRKAFNFLDKEVVDKLVFNYVDEFADLERWQKKFGKLPQEQDAFAAQQLYSGRVGARVSDFHDDQLNPLFKTLHESGLTYQQLEEYLYAKHAPSRNAEMAKINVGPDNQALSGMSTERAVEIISEAKRLGIDKKLNELAKMVYAITAKTRENLVAGGLLLPEEKAAWEKKYQDYVPLHRDEVALNSVPLGKGFNIKGKESKRATGSTKEASNILAWTLAQHEASIIRSEKNRADLALYRLLEAHPDDTIATVDNPDVRKMIDKSSGMAVLRVDPLYKNTTHVLTFKIDGIEHTISFNEQSPEAMRMAMAYKGMGARELGDITKAVGQFTRFLAMMSTSANPVFTFTNFNRDIQTAFVNLHDTPIADKKAEVFKLIPSAMKAFYQMSKGNFNSELSKYAREYRDAGGQVGWLEGYKDISDRAQHYKDLISSMGPGKLNASKRAMTEWWNLIQDANSAVENSVRLAAYVVARKQGISPSESALIAKNLTVNFNIRGYKSTEMNMWYMFSKASINGTARIIRASRNPTARKVIGGIILTGFLLDMLARSMAGDDDKDGENDYDQLPEYVKSNNWVFWGNGRPITFSQPYGYNFFSSLGRISSALLFRKSYGIVDGAGDMFNIFINAFNPLGNSGSILQSVFPTIADPFIQLKTNTNFAGNPIYKEQLPFGAPKPEYQMGFKSASIISKALAKWLNDISGGNEERPGKINLNPSSLDFAVASIFGGAGKSYLQALSLPMKILNGDDISAREIPFVNVYLGKNQEGQAARKFYPNLDLISTVAREYKNPKVDRAKLELEHGEELKLIGYEKSVVNRMKRLNDFGKRLDNATDKDSTMIATMRNLVPAENKNAGFAELKKIALAQNEKTKNKVMNEFNLAVSEALKKQKAKQGQSK